MKILFLILLLFPNIIFGNEVLAKKIYLKAKVDFLSKGCSFKDLNLLIKENSKLIEKKDLECMDYYLDYTLKSFNEIKLKYSESLVYKVLINSNEYIEENKLENLLYLMKNTSEANNEELQIILKKKPNKDIYNTSTTFTEKTVSTITFSEIDLLIQQLHSCLNLNVGVANLKDIKPVIFIEMNPDRTVKSAKIVNQERLSDPSFRTAAEAAMRAVNNPDCSPLLLPEGKYDLWKEINFTFDFSWMFD